MILKKLRSVNFRNYDKIELELNNKFNFIYGNNGHGKTNILEAVSFISFAKSFLNSSEADCLKFGSNEFTVYGEYITETDNIEALSVTYDNISKRKSFYLNKEKVTKISSEVFGRFPVVFLSPHSLEITYGNPSERRKFFDILISQASTLYLDNLKTLAKLLKQKNAALKNNLHHRSYSPHELTNLLKSYNEKLADVSASIVFRRLKFLEEFKEIFEKNFTYLAGSSNFASIKYISDMYGEISCDEIKNFPFDRLEKLIKDDIDYKSSEEIARGVSITGPQRDDYGFRLKKSPGGEETGAFDLKNHASQGEHKTFVSALKLAEFDYLKDKRGTSPVLLLDDILSELDSERVSQIISRLKDFGQIFLTTTDKGYLEHIKNYYGESEVSIYKVVNGTVRQE